MKAYLRLGRDMTWPNPQYTDDLEWRFRYGEVSRSDQLVAASIISAYRELVNMTAERRRRIIRSMRASTDHPH